MIVHFLSFVFSSVLMDVATFNSAGYILSASVKYEALTKPIGPRLVVGSSAAVFLHEITFGLAF